MSNDNQAKSYIATVLARADAATKGPWEVWDGCSWRRIGSVTTDRPVISPTNARSDGHPDLDARQEDLAFCAASRQDIPNLAKMLERAIEALESIDDEDMRCCDVSMSEKIAHAALADLDALAKGIQ